MKQLHLFDSSVGTTGYRDWELDNFESVEESCSHQWFLVWKSDCTPSLRCWKCHSERIPHVSLDERAINKRIASLEELREDYQAHCLRATSKVRKKQLERGVAEKELQITNLRSLLENSITDSKLEAEQDSATALLKGGSGSAPSTSVIELAETKALAPSAAPSSITDSKLEAEQDSLVIELGGCLGTYAKKGKDYYRFSYREGTKTHHYHIKGGCIGTPTADAKARQIREAIAASRTRSEILALLE